MLEREISRYAAKARQAIMLTHNSDFLKILATEGAFASGHGVTYIQVFAHGTPGATLKALSLEDHLREEHARRLARLVEWESKGVFHSTSEVFKDLRRSLEYLIDVKWGHKLGAAQNLGDQYRVLKSKQLLPEDVLEKINDIHKTTSSQLHDNQTYHVLRDASSGETWHVLQEGIALMEKV